MMHGTVVDAIAGRLGRPAARLARPLGLLVDIGLATEVPPASPTAAICELDSKLLKLAG